MNQLNVCFQQPQQIYAQQRANIINQNNVCVQQAYQSGNPFQQSILIGQCDKQLADALSANDTQLYNGLSACLSSASSNFNSNKCPLTSTTSTTVPQNQVEVITTTTVTPNVVAVNTVVEEPAAVVVATNNNYRPPYNQCVANSQCPSNICVSKLNGNVCYDQLPQYRYVL